MIKTRVSDSSLNAMYSCFRSAPYFGAWNSEYVTRVVPNGNMFHSLHQALFMDVNVGLYGFVSET